MNVDKLTNSLKEFNTKYRKNCTLVSEINWSGDLGSGHRELRFYRGLPGNSSLDGEFSCSQEGSLYEGEYFKEQKKSGYSLEDVPVA